MTTHPAAPLQFLQGSTLNPIDVEVSSFPLDPTEEGTIVSFQAAAAWSNVLVLEDVEVEVRDVGPTLGLPTGRFSFTLSVEALDTTALPPGPYYCAFVVEPAGGGRAYIPASGRLHVDILPTPVEGA